MLKIVIGYYGIEWKSYHGATGGVTCPNKTDAEAFAGLVTLIHPQLPGYQGPDDCGLWPGQPQQVVYAELVGDEERGFIIATCENVDLSGS